MKGWGGAVALALALVSCSSGQVPVTYLIGVSQANLSEPWRVSMTDEIRQQAALHPELRIIIADASDSLGKQIGDVEKFEGLGVDLLIISPLESEAITPTVTRVYHSIPVIVLNRSVANYDYTLFIGPDNARIGQEAGRFVAQTLKSHGGGVLEILGRSGSPPTLERAEGFRREIARNPRIRLQSPVLANWLRDAAQDSVADRLRADQPPQVIFAHNDDMAYGAWLAAQSLGLAKKITFVGVDGLPGPRGGQELLRSGILDGTLVSPTGGKEAVEFALALLRHEGEQPKKVILGTKFLTRAELEAPRTPNLGRGPWSVAFLPSSGTDRWREQLHGSVAQALGVGGSLTVLGADNTVPSGVSAVVVDTSDQGDQDRHRRAVVEDEARARGLPLLRVGPQPPQGDDGGWAVALGPDPGEEGLRGGRWLAGQGRGAILEIAGPVSWSGTDDRSAGLGAGLTQRGAGRVVDRVVTDGTRTGGSQAVTAALARGVAFDGIFAHSLELALGAADALAAQGGPGHRPVVGVGGDALSLAALKDGRIDCLIRSPSNLGPLLRSALDRLLVDGGVSRRLITTYGAVTP